MQYPFKTIALEDGRKLAYTEFGDRSGFPVINCHGGLVNRLDMAWADAAAKQNGIRLISPDRPGIGFSDYKADRSILDWANDVKQLSRHLGLHKFGIIGWSMGGQYALACAYALPKNVTKVVLIAGCLELAERKNFTEINPMDRRLSRIAHNFSWLAWLIYWGMKYFVRLFPSVWRRISAKQFDSTDAEIVSNQSFDFVTPTKQALRKPKGMIEEYRTFIKPWNFKLSELSTPIDIWQGKQDVYVTYKWAEVFSRQLPNSKLHLIHNAGHFIAHRYIVEMFRAFKT